uniref:G_PROTEIN_RECEP_F1_2 domain-containing protein n=1 Tax=Haemonchus contortus TaxID=6289 RepID=A0A7I5EDU4_HAECO
MNGTDEIATQDQFTLGETIFYLSNGAVGSIFNCIVLWIAFVHIDTDDKPRQIIVINMTFADLLMCLCYMLTRPYLNYFPKVLCHPYYVTIWTIQLVSCLNLVWLNVDKLIFIQFPLHYYSIINRRKVFIVSVVTWIVLGYIAFAVNAFMTISGGCDRVIINPYIYMPICVLYVVMILTSFIISAIIYFIAHTSTRSETRQRTKLFHRLFFLFSSTLWTFFTCLPYRILYLLNFLCAPCRSEMVHQMTDAFFRILVVGMVINPLITIWTQRIYRMHLLKFFNKWQDTRDDTEVSVRRHSTKLNMVESMPLTTAL